MPLDIRTLLVAVALANAFCAGARLLLWRMHPSIPGLGRWALAGGLGALALVLILSHGAAPWLPSLSLAQVLAVTGLVLAWDGFRRFLGRAPLSMITLIIIGAVVAGWLAVTQLQGSIEVRALGNDVLISILSALIARELFNTSSPAPLAMRTTAWAYAVNSAFFLVRAVTIIPAAEPVGPLNPDGFAPVTLLWWLGMTVAVTLGMVLMTAERLQADLDNQANRDPLTGALNRRAFAVIAGTALARARRSAQPLSVLTMDLDHFKRINDHLGHDAGDTLLCHFVSTARNLLRGEDVFCRFGGEEFVALLPDTSAQQALMAAERLRTTYADRSRAIQAPGTSTPMQMTVSIGIGQLAQGEDIDSLLRRADAALYRAKGLGRNRCEVDDSPAEPTDTKATIEHATQLGR